MKGQPTIAYTVAQAAEMLGVNRQTIERLIRRGELPARKIGSQWRIPFAAIDDFGEVAS